MGRGEILGISGNWLGCGIKSGPESVSALNLGLTNEAKVVATVAKRKLNIPSVGFNVRRERTPAYYEEYRKLVEQFMADGVTYGRAHGRAYSKMNRLEIAQKHRTPEHRQKIKDHEKRATPAKRKKQRDYQRDWYWKNKAKSESERYKKKPRTEAQRAHDNTVTKRRYYRDIADPKFIARRRKRRMSNYYKNRAHINALQRTAEKRNMRATILRQKEFGVSSADVSLRLRRLAQGALCRARKGGLPYDDDLPDFLSQIDVRYCMNCNKLLNYYEGKRAVKDDSPSIDKIDNDGGYLKTNVAILCYQCNRTKSNQTRQMFLKWLHYMDNAASTMMQKFKSSPVKIKRRSVAPRGSS